MASYTIRMVTFHVENAIKKKPRIREEVEELLEKTRETLDVWSQEHDVLVEGARLTLPDTPPGQIKELLSRMGYGWKDDGYIVSVGHIPGETGDLARLLEDIAGRGLYAAIDMPQLNWSIALHVSKALSQLAREPVFATRIGVSLGSPLLTPYYPLSWSPGNAAKATVALTFPNYLREAYVSGGTTGMTKAMINAAEKALSALEHTSETMEVAPTGVDLSISPWMDESSLGLVETVAGVEVDEPGIALGIRIVEDVIQETLARIGRGVGFNMIQLPVAEDSLMKQRAVEGKLTAKTLARLSGVCLAGLDLAVVPKNEKRVAGLLLEVGAYARAKGATLGVRIIPVDAEPGDTVDLGIFGDVRVIPF